jgi:hypothetical protein
MENDGLAELSALFRRQLSDRQWKKIETFLATEGHRHDQVSAPELL